MQIVNYKEKLNNKIVATIGYFDAIHLGHIELIKKAVENSTTTIKSTVILFNGGFKDKDVFSIEERLKKLEKLNVDIAIIVNVDENFKRKSPIEFLDEITSYYNFYKIITGEDFTFGKNASGNIQILGEYLKNKDILFESVKKIKYDKQIDVSTSLIKNLLSLGQIEKVNLLLDENYNIFGKVISGKKLGRTIDFPTANINIKNSSIYLKQGVYLTKTHFNSRAYNSITNVGTQPTVNGSSVVIETHIKNFNENIYDKHIKVEFIKYIRDIKKFSSIEELKNQLSKDMESIDD